MKMERTMFLELARKVAKGIDNNSIIDVMKCIRICAKDDRVSLSSVSSTISICAEAECEEKKTIDCIVEGSKLTNILSKLTESEIELQLKKDFLHIISGKTNVKLHIMDLSKWIHIPEFVPETTIDVKTEDIQETLHAVAKNNHNGTLMSCVCIHVYEQGYQITTLDGYRISQRTEEPEGNLLGEYLIEASFIEKALSLAENTAVIECNNNRIRISTDKISVFGSLTAGKYFNMDRLINTPLSHVIKVDRTHLLKEIQVSRVINDLVYLKFGNTLQIIAENSVDNFNSELVYEEKPVGLDDPITLYMTADLLIEALKSIDEEIVTIYFEAARNPLCIKNSAYMELVLPRSDGKR